MDLLWVLAVIVLAVVVGRCTNAQCLWHRRLGGGAAARGTSNETSVRRN